MHSLGTCVCSTSSFYRAPSAQQHIHTSGRTANSGLLCKGQRSEQRCQEPHVYHGAIVPVLPAVYIHLGDPATPSKLKCDGSSQSFPRRWLDPPTGRRATSCTPNTRDGGVVVCPLQKTRAPQSLAFLRKCFSPEKRATFRHVQQAIDSIAAVREVFVKISQTSIVLPSRRACKHTNTCRDIHACMTPQSSMCVECRPYAHACVSTCLLSTCECGELSIHQFACMR